MSAIQMILEFGNEVREHSLSSPAGSPGLEVKMIRGFAVDQCPVCGCFHPDEPFFEDSTYTFYDSECFVVDNRANK